MNVSKRNSFKMLVSAILVMALLVDPIGFNYALAGETGESLTTGQTESDTAGEQSGTEGTEELTGAQPEGNEGQSEETETITAGAEAAADAGSLVNGPTASDDSVNFAGNTWTVVVSDYAFLKNAIENMVLSGDTANITLNNDISMGSGDTAIELDKGITINFNANGKKFVATEGERHFIVKSDDIEVNLNLNDLTLDGGHDNDGDHWEENDLLDMTYGGIMVEDPAVLTLKGGIIENCFNYAGAVIVGGEDAKLTLHNTVIRNNIAMYGGGISNHGSTFEMHSGEIINNKAIVRGGGVSNVSSNSGSASRFTMHDGTISGNKVLKGGADGGGGVFNGTGDVFTMKAGTISENKAVQGGGIFNTGSDGEFYMEGGTISNNEAVQFGGGVYAGYETTFHMTGGKISGNKVTGEKDVNIANDPAGGGIYLERNNDFKMTAGTEVIDNHVLHAGRGGGIHIGYGYTVNVDGATISENEAAEGGGIYIRENATLEIKNSTVSQNMAVDGGGICVKGGAALNLTDSTISENTAENHGAGIDVGGAAAYDAPENATLNMTSGTISENEAKQGGGVYLNSGSLFNMTGGTISGNEAVHGGGAYLKGAAAVIKIEDGEISGNTAEAGGGVFNIGGAVVFSGGKISGNKAILLSSSGESGNGGGIYSTSESVIEISGGEISGNQAENGAGIYESYGTLKIKNDSKIINNNAVQNGGGIYTNSSSQKMEIADSEISGNEGGAQGGGIYMVNDTAEVKGTKIDNNNAEYGGGILLTSATLNISTSEITGNTANEQGGGICLLGYSTLNMLSGQISGNNADEGGGVHNNYYSKFNMEDGKISGNEAKRGGGVYNTMDSEFDMKAGQISGNTAENGGGIYTLDLKKVSIGSNAVFAGNKALKYCNWDMSADSGNPDVQTYQSKVLTNAFSTYTKSSGGTPVMFENAYNNYDINYARGFTVTFDPNGGTFSDATTALKTVQVDAGYSVTKPADPTKSNEIFEGWELDGSIWDFNNTVIKDIVLKAKYKKTTDPGGPTDPEGPKGPTGPVSPERPGNVITDNKTEPKIIPPAVIKTEDVYEAIKEEETPLGHAVQEEEEVLLEEVTQESAPLSGIKKNPKTSDREIKMTATFLLTATFLSAIFIIGFKKQRTLK